MLILCSEKILLVQKAREDHENLLIFKWRMAKTIRHWRYPGATILFAPIHTQPQ